MRYFQRRREQAESRIIVALAVGEQFGYPLMRTTGLRPGRLYPALVRLESTGRIISGWIEGPYPRRRFYRLTELEEGSDA
jgi:DNA-binding PadR family transcriptional regulator